jgi:autotransporter-associated beta strand protein
VLFGKGNTVNFQWDDSTFKDGSYTMIETEGDLLTVGGNQLTAGDMLDTKFLHGGAALTDPRNSAELRIVIAEGGMKKIVLTTWANKSAAVYWDGKSGTPGGTSDDWNKNSNNENWLAAAEKHVSFKDGDIAIFNDDAWAKTVVVDAGGVTVYAMMVTTTQGGTYTFEGGAITGDAGSWTQGALPNAASRLLVEANATAIFNNKKVEFPSIEVKGTAVFNTEVIVTDAGDGAFKATGNGYIRLGNKGSFSGYSNILLDGENTILDFNRTNMNYTYDGVISGSGNVRKTGDAEVTLSGQNTYAGKTIVSGGRLVVTGLLGADNNGNYGGGILIGETGVLAFNQTQDQILSGRMEGTGALEKKGTGKLTLTHPENSYTGSISVSNGEMEVAGLLGAVYETFDKGTPYEATYVSGHYKGDLDISENAKLTFSYEGDYQVLAGGLTGDGTLAKAGAMPLYFLGDAGAWEGTTLVIGGSFHISTSTPYGSTTENGSFTVAKGAALYVGGGGKIITNTMRLAAGATLVSNPGMFVIQVENADNVKIEKNAEFVFRLGANDVDTDAAPKAKVAFVDANGNAAGVGLPDTVGLKLLPFGYMPQPTLDGHFTLMTGLDVSAIAGSNESYDDVLLRVFGFNELEIMKSMFELHFTSDGRLILKQVSYSPYPEPATYGLFSGILVAGLAVLHHRRKKGKPQR